MFKCIGQQNAASRQQRQLMLNDKLSSSLLKLALKNSADHQN